MQMPTNVVNTTPDFLLGYDKGHPVLLPGSMAQSGPTNNEIPRYQVDSSGNVTGLLGPGNQVLSLSETTAYVTRTTTGTAFSGACEFAGYVCTVAAGNITVYDNTSAAGTVIVPTTALAVGAFPIFGAGTNGKMALTTGCHVVLSGAATVNLLVQ